MLRSTLHLVFAAALAAGFVSLAFGDTSAKIDASRYLGQPMQIENLTVWPVLTTARVATAEFLSLHQARDKGLVTVREKGTDSRDQRHDGATVGELMIENRGDRPILVTAGTIVKGGKQDRQLGQDLVVAANSTVPVGAFCVEQSRWSQQREGRQTGGVFEIPKVKAAKRVRSAGQYSKDQGQVWRQVAEVNNRAEKAPDTGTFLAAVEDDDRSAVELRARLSAAVSQHFAGLENPQAVVGFAYSVNGEPLGMRAFANRQLFDSHFEPFLATMSLETQIAQHRDRRAGRATYDRPAPREALLKMVHSIAAAKVEVSATSGLNTNHVRHNDWGGHSSCRIQAGEREIALTEDWTAPAELGSEVREQLRRLEALGYTED